MPQVSPRVLFVLKKQVSYGYHGASGLRNSAAFVVEMLLNHGISAKLVMVDDNNDSVAELVAKLESPA